MNTDSFVSTSTRRGQIQIRNIWNYKYQHDLTLRSKIFTKLNGELIGNLYKYIYNYSISV